MQGTLAREKKKGSHWASPAGLFRACKMGLTLGPFYGPVKGLKIGPDFGLSDPTSKSKNERK